jgi:Ca-activated chloride channel family protein
MGKLSFLNPEFFWLFLLIPMAVAWMYWKRNEQSATLKMSSTQGFKGSDSLVARLKPVLNVFRIL